MIGKMCATRRPRLRHSSRLGERPARVVPFMCCRRRSICVPTRSRQPCIRLSRFIPVLRGRQEDVGRWLAAAFVSTFSAMMFHKVIRTTRVHIDRETHLGDPQILS